jgi:3-oxoacyl-[acyl-carrier protein] reductase
VTLDDAAPVTLVTGSRTGIGRHLVEHYAGLGHRVVGCSRGASDFAHESYLHFQLDVGDEAAVRAMLADIRRRYGRLHHLVNNAGAAGMNHALLTPGATLEQLFRTNALGTFLMSREAARLMLRSAFGRIVNFSTVAVPFALEGEAAYVASKSAVEGLTRVLARELAPLGITVNAVGPGPMDSALTRGVPPEKLAAVTQRQAIPRQPTLAELAHLIDFLLHRDSGMLTGQVIYLGGV